MIWANKSEDIGTNKRDAHVHRFPSRSNFALLKETLDHGSWSLFKLKQGCMAPNFIADDNLASHNLGLPPIYRGSDAAFYRIR